MNLHSSSRHGSNINTSWPQAVTEICFKMALISRYVKSHQHFCSCRKWFACNIPELCYTSTLCYWCPSHWNMTDIRHRLMTSHSLKKDVILRAQYILCEEEEWDADKLTATGLVEYMKWSCNNILVTRRSQRSGKEHLSSHLLANTPKWPLWVNDNTGGQMLYSGNCHAECC